MTALDADERARLEAAERALVVYGWCAIGTTERERAAFELWRRWSALVPAGFLDREAHPEIDERALATSLLAQDQHLARLMKLLKPPDEPT